jgi:hypothetical protein
MTKLNTPRSPFVVREKPYTAQGSAPRPSLTGYPKNSGATNRSPVGTPIIRVTPNFFLSAVTARKQQYSHLACVGSPCLSSLQSSPRSRSNLHVTRRLKKDRHGSKWGVGATSCSLLFPACSSRCCRITLINWSAHWSGRIQTQLDRGQVWRANFSSMPPPQVLC